jgi:hypothetical protein
MRSRLSLVAGFSLCLLIAAGAAAVDPNDAAVSEAQLAGFADLVNEAGLVFNPPPDYRDVIPQANPVMDYERALRSTDGALEVRYAVRPLQRLKIDYDDPHGAVPDPNHIFPLMFESLASRLAAGRHSPSREYSAADAAGKFNADWAAAAVFDVNPEFKADYRQGLVLGLHKSRQSDAYVVILFDDYQAVKPRLSRAMSSLVYPAPDP